MLSAPAETGGSRPTLLSSALWLSRVVEHLSPMPTEGDIVDFFANPFRCNINTFTPQVSATDSNEAFAMAAQAKITDSNTSATTNIWFWISGLGSLNLELAQLLARWFLVAAKKSRRPRKSWAAANSRNTLLSWPRSTNAWLASLV
jgi:hypothetical protein